jgi:hypothetical protein
MRIIKFELAAVAWLLVVASARAFAQAPANDPAPQPTPQAQPSEESEPITCPAPNQPCPSQQPAQAQPPASTTPYAEPTYAETQTEDWLHNVGAAISVGGGVDDFANSAMRDTTGTGGSWTARLTLGTRSYVAGEISYIGSAQSISQLGLSSNSTLFGNGAQAVLRLNATVNYPIQPFIFGGAAWRHYSLSTSGTNFSDVATNSDAVEIPLGLGVGGYVATNLMLDVRGEYRFAWVNHAIVPEIGTGTNVFDRWGVTGNIGYAW